MAISYLIYESAEVASPSRTPTGYSWYDNKRVWTNWSDQTTLRSADVAAKVEQHSKHFLWSIIIFLLSCKCGRMCHWIIKTVYERCDGTYRYQWPHADKDPWNPNASHPFYLDCQVRAATVPACTGASSSARPCWSCSRSGLASRTWCTNGTSEVNIKKGNLLVPRI